MKHPFRSARTSSRTSKSLSTMGAAGIVAVGALLAGSSLLGGCGDSGGDGGDPSKGGQTSEAGSDGGDNTPGGESNGTGATTGVSGSQNDGGGNGGTQSGNGGASSSDGGDVATSGGATGGQDPSGVGLGNDDGITGTFEGKVHTHLFNVAHVPQQTETSVIGANSAMYPLWDLWTIRYLPKLGEQPCTGDTGTDDTFITFGSQTNFSQAGTTAGAKGACTINVTSLAPKIEGTFTATLTTDHGAVEVTDGAFRVPN